jgi:gliding motility-associated-like protein
MKSRLLFFFLFFYYISYSQLVVDFSSDKNKGCGRTAIRFDAQKSSGYSSFLWNFGNGQTNNDELRPLVMFDPGNYTVTFTVYNGAQSSQKTMNILIHKAPSGSIVFSAADRGCTGQTINFSASAVAGDASIISYQWIYGDGNKGTGMSSSHAYLYPNATPGYPLVLEITDVNNCSFKTFEYIPISDKPQLKIIPGSYYTCDSTSVKIGSNVTSIAPVKTYKWDLGDGTSSNKQQPGLHKYNAPGQYKLTFEATDVNGCKNNTETVIHILNLKADIDVADSVCKGTKILLKNKEIVAGTYLWTINDTLHYNADSLGIETNKLDSVYVKLKLSNNYCTSYDSTLIRISTAKAQFVMDTSWVCKFPYEVKFTNTSVGNIVSYNWDFGDGKVSSEINPKHTFSKASNIRLNIVSNAGCKSQYQGKISLKRPKPVINMSEDEGCVPKNILFTADSSIAVSSITNYQWEAYNGKWTSSSTFSQTNFSYTLPMKDTVRLTITDKICGNETVSKVLRLGNHPKVGFTCADTFLISQENTAINISQPKDSIDLYRWTCENFSLEKANLKWKPFVDTAYYSPLGEYYVFEKSFPKPNSQVKIQLMADFYSCKDSITKTVVMQGPVAEIDSVYKVSCDLPTQINFKYTIYDAFKVDYEFGNLKSGQKISGSYVYNRDTTISETKSIVLQPGFYNFFITAHNSKNNHKSKVSYHRWECPSISGPCIKENYVIAVSDKVKANFVTDKTRVCRGELVKLDASGSANSVLNMWSRTSGIDNTEFIQPLYSFVPAKNEPLICRANSFICSLSMFFAGFPLQSCSGDSVTYPIDSTKTNIIFCERGNYDVTLISVASNGCTDSMVQKKIIKVFDPSAVLTSNDPRVCIGDEITFKLQNIIEDTTITSYTLDFGNGSSHNLSSASENVQKTYSPGVYQPFILLKDKLGCENKLAHATLNKSKWVEDVVVSSDPKVSITSEGISCKGHDMFLKADSGLVSYAWNFGDGYTTLTSGNAVSHGFNLPGTYSVMLTALDTVNCSVAANSNIQVLSEPVFNITVDTPYWGCPLAILTIDDASGNQYIISRTWEMVNKSLNISSPVISSPSSTIVMPVIYPGVYDVKLEFSSAYCGTYNTSLTDAFRMNGPFMEMASVKDFYCRKNEIVFKPDSSVLYNNPVFRGWNFLNNKNGKLYFSDTVSTTRIFEEPGDYKATMFYADTLGCEMIDTALFVVDSLKASFKLPDPICEVPIIIELINQSEGVDSIVWKMNSEITNTVNYIDTITEFGSYPLLLKVFDKLGCNDSVLTIIKANPKPFGITGISDTLICGGDSVRIKTSFNSSYTYQWSPSVNIAGANLYNPKVYPNTNTTYVVGVSDIKTFCTITDTFYVFVQDIPEISFGYNYLPYSVTEVFDLNNNNIINIPLGDSIRFVVISNQQKLVYNWSNVDNLLNCIKCPDPAMKAMKQTLIKVVPVDSLGCYSKILERQFEIVPIGSKILMATAFTPNGDLINDVIKVEGPGIEKLVYFRIYNYSGNLVFETSDLNEGWDGKYNKKIQPVGIYFYKVKVLLYNQTQEYEQSGSIKLIK